MKWLCFLLIAMSLILTGCEKGDRSAGKDTIKSFGNGRFQLFKGNSGRTLMDVKEQDTLLLNSENWRCEGNHLYAYGDNGKYVIIDLKAETCLKYANLDEVPQEYREKVSLLRNCE